MKKDIFDYVLELSGERYISDLKCLGDQLLEVLSEIEYERFAGEDIKKLMVYIFGKHEIV